MSLLGVLRKLALLAVLCMAALTFTAATPTPALLCVGCLRCYGCPLVACAAGDNIQGCVTCGGPPYNVQKCWDQTKRIWCCPN